MSIQIPICKLIHRMLFHNAFHGAVAKIVPSNVSNRYRNSLPEYRGKANCYIFDHTYDPEPATVLRSFQKSGDQFVKTASEIMGMFQECLKTRRVKGCAYHKEKMLLCKQEDSWGSVELQTSLDWKDVTDEELKNRNWKHHYMYMAQLQELQAELDKYKDVNYAQRWN
ncbi:hypothetical protein Tco_0276975 [Tanacetum coccineum]